MNQRKQAVDLTETAIGLLVLGIVISIGSWLLLTYRDTRLTDLSIGTTVNETTYFNSTGDTLSNSWVKSISVCYNRTAGNGVAIETGNYSSSISNYDGTAQVLNATAVNWPNVSCTYTWYNTSRADYQLANDSMLGIGEYGNWFKIIAIVSVAALILGMIFLAFGNRSSSVENVGVSY